MRQAIRSCFSGIETKLPTAMRLHIGIDRKNLPFSAQQPTSNQNHFVHKIAFINIRIELNVTFLRSQFLAATKAETREFRINPMLFQILCNAGNVHSIRSIHRHFVSIGVYVCVHLSPQCSPIYPYADRNPISRFAFNCLCNVQWELARCLCGRAQIKTVAMLTFSIRSMPRITYTCVDLW